MPAIAGSSPLILFARLHRLDIIRDLFAEVFVPPAVMNEVVDPRAQAPGAVSLRRAEWLRVRPVGGVALVESLAATLDPGGTEAVALAIEEVGRLPLLIDDLAGRRIARSFGLPIVGSAGVLVLAKRAGIIVEVRPILDALLGAGLYLTEPIYGEILNLAGESGD